MTQTVLCFLIVLLRLLGLGSDSQFDMLEINSILSQQRSIHTYILSCATIFAWNSLSSSVHFCFGWFWINLSLSTVFNRIIWLYTVVTATVKMSFDCDIKLSKRYGEKIMSQSVYYLIYDWFEKLQKIYWHRESPSGFEKNRPFSKLPILICSNVGQCIGDFFVLLSIGSNKYS